MQMPPPLPSVPEVPLAAEDHFLDNARWSLISNLVWLSGMLLLLGIVAIALIPFVLMGGQPVVLELLMPRYAGLVLLGGAAMPLLAQRSFDLSAWGVAALVSVMFAKLSAVDGAVTVPICAALLVGIGIGIFHALVVCITRAPGILVTLATGALTFALATSLSSSRLMQLRQGIDLRLPMLMCAALVVLAGAALFLHGPQLRRRSTPSNLGTLADQRGAWRVRLVWIALPYVLSSAAAALFSIFQTLHMRVADTHHLHTGIEVESLAVALGAGALFGRRSGSAWGVLIAAAFPPLLEMAAALRGFDPEAPMLSVSLFLIVLLPGSHLYAMLVQRMYRRRMERRLAVGRAR